MLRVDFIFQEDEDGKYNSLLVSHDGKEILPFTDDLDEEVPFPTFYLDCFWVKELIEKVYKLGHEDGFSSAAFLYSQPEE